MQSRTRNSISPPAASKGRKRRPSNENHIDEPPEKKVRRNRAVNKDTGEGETRKSARLKGGGRETSDAFISSESNPTSLQAFTKKRGAKGKQKETSDVYHTLEEVIPTSSSLQGATENRDAKGKGRLFAHIDDPDIDSPIQPSAPAAGNEPGPDQVALPSDSLSPSSSFEKLDLTKLDLNSVAANMNERCQQWSLQASYDNAIRNPQSWPMVISLALILLTGVLSTTNIQRSVIPPLSLANADIIAKGLKAQEQEDWINGLGSGLKNGDWASLITHRTLRNRKARNVALGVPIEFQDAVVRAWGMKYLGNAHLILLRAVDDIHTLTEARNYAKLFPIAQSSGTGKSKTVDQAAMQRILFPLCLREHIGSKFFAYPPADEAVRNYLVSAPSTSESSQCKQYLASFLCSLFTSAMDLTAFLFPKKTKYEAMALAIHDYFNTSPSRDDFYKHVVDNAGKYTNIDVWETFDKLEKTLELQCTDWPNTKLTCPILVSIDEVHVLYTHRNQDSGSNYTLYSCLKSVLNQGVSHNFAIISLSTASQVSSIAPSKALAASVRESADERDLPAPFTELPFDAFINNDPVTPGCATTTSVGTLEFTAKFGRPLLYATYLSRKGDGEIVNGMMRNIREKLSGRSWPPDAQAKLDTSSIAVLSARLLLDLSPSTATAQQYDEELIRNHLRMLYSVHKDRQTIVTGSSSEPLVAEASAQIMHHTLDNGVPYMDVWNLLERFVDHGLAAQGAIGELIGRALSISAMDCAIEKKSKLCELKYQTPVTVVEYYQSLLTKEAWEVLRYSIPANRAQLGYASGSKTFEQAFKDAYFHFSHYVRANDSSPMCDRFAWANWLRGAAFVCQPNQELTDRMTPIYFSSLGKISPETMSANLDQDKTGRSVDPIYVSTQSAEALGIFSLGNKHNLPYIAAVHCYASTKKSITVPEPPIRNLRSMKNNVNMEAPRYQIDICGLNAYANLTDAVKISIRAMLDHSKNSLFNNHSRPYAVPAVRQMLPVFSDDLPATQWLRQGQGEEEASGGEEEASRASGSEEEAKGYMKGRR